MAAELHDAFADGVGISLAPLRDPALVIPAIAQTLGIAGRSPASRCATASAPSCATGSCCSCWITSSSCWRLRHRSPHCWQRAAARAAGHQPRSRCTSRASSATRSRRWQLPTSRRVPLEALSRYAAVQLFVAAGAGGDSRTSR